MNALIRKEVRLLLPGWLTALLLTFSIWLVPNVPGSSFGLSAFIMVFPFLLYPAMIVMMALDSFGREMSAGTFSLLLSQPIARSRIWWTKILLLAAALLSVMGAWWFSCALHFRELLATPDWKAAPIATIVVLFVLAIFSGGLWTVLLLRQVAAAFWFTLIAPGAILMTVAGLLRDYPDRIKPMLIFSCVLYSVAGFFWAWRMFERAQDVQWTGGTIALPNWRGRAASFAPRTAKGRRPRRALWAKEFQLHQSQLVVAGLLALLHLGVLATRKFGGTFAKSPFMDVVLSGFWLLWFVMPFLIGCAAVAEERKLGTLEGQLCLPVRRRTQFLIKFCCAFLLAMVLGVVVPFLLEGSRILPEFGNDFSHSAIIGAQGIWLWIGRVFSVIVILLPFLTLVGIAAITTILAFYASTLARNTMQALAPAALGFVVTWALIVFLHGEGPLYSRFWRGPLVYLIGVPVMTLSLAGLMYWNFKRVLVGWNVWRRNALVLVASLVFVTTATATIYHRAWELLVPIEPPHGTPRLASSEVVMKSDFYTVLIQLSDGHVWRTYCNPFALMMTTERMVNEALDHGKFLEGTNWTSIDRCNQDFVGIQRDGSLWVLELERFARPGSASNAPLSERAHWKRIGRDNDWKNAAGSYSECFLLKTNGTLWALGTNAVPGAQPWPGLSVFEPERLGTESDWTAVYSAIDRQIIFQKADGRVWVFPGALPQDDKIIFERNLAIHRAPYRDGYKAVTGVPGPPGFFEVGIAADGTFRVNAVTGPLPKLDRKQPTRWGLLKEDIQLGTESDWLSLASIMDPVVALKADGSLWKWTFPEYPNTDLASAVAVRVGTSSDWIAIVAAAGGVFSLAADGTLWFWQFESRRNNSPGYNPLFSPSRRPRLVGNIFAAGQ